jgi:hypothetical protein
MESRPVYPEISTAHDDLDYEGWREIRDQFEEKVSINSPEFWKSRIIVHLPTTPICSATFLPYDLQEEQTWHVQKGEAGPRDGFFAPFFDKETVQYINNDQDIVDSLQNLEYDHELYTETLLLLYCFLRDPLTRGICFTFSLRPGVFATRCWEKPDF